MYFDAHLVLDVVNASFEIAGAGAQFLNVRRLLRDKEVKGVIWQFTLFNIAWCLVNCFLYPVVHMWISFYAGLIMCAANIIWYALAIKYTYLNAGWRSLVP